MVIRLAQISHEVDGQASLQLSLNSFPAIMRLEENRIYLNSVVSTRDPNIYNFFKLTLQKFIFLQ